MNEQISCECSEYNSSTRSHPLEEENHGPLVELKVVIYSTNFGQRTEIDFQMNANELYSIVKPARIVGIFRQTTLVTSIGIHAV